MREYEVSLLGLEDPSFVERLRTREEWGSWVGELGLTSCDAHANNLARLHRVSGKSGSSGTPQCLCSFIRPDV
jgi:hypothetical protein